MSAVNILIAAAVVFVFMRAICEPKLRPGRKIWDRVLGLEPVDAVMLAGVRFAGTFSLLAGLGAGVGMVLTWWVESLDFIEIGSVAGQDTVDQVNQILNLFDAGELVLSRLGVFIATVYMVLLAAGLLFWLARPRRGVRKQIKASVNELRELGIANKLPPMPPDERMKRADEAIAAARSANEELHIIEALYEKRFQYDLVRRLDPVLLRSIGEPDPGSHVARVLRFLISMPLSYQVKKTGRIVSALAMVTFVPASLVIASSDLGEAMDSKRPELEAWATALTLEVVMSAQPLIEKPLNRMENQTEKKGGTNEKNEVKQNEKEWCEANGDVLSTDACIAATEFGVAFEAALGASLMERSGTRLQVQDAIDGVGKARRDWARRQVLIASVTPRMSKINVAEAASDAQEYRDRINSVTEAEIKAWTGHGPVSSFGEQAREMFGNLVRGSERISGSVTVEVANRPLTPLELLSTALLASVDPLIEGVSSRETNPLIEKLGLGPSKEMAGKLVEEKVRRIAKLGAMSIVSPPARDTTGGLGESIRIDEDRMGMVDMFVHPDLARIYKELINQVMLPEFAGQRGNPAFARVSLEAAPSDGFDRSKAANALHQYREATGDMSFDSLASYSSIFPGIVGQRAQTEEARIARILDAENANAEYGKMSEILDDAGGKGGLKKIRPAETTPAASKRLDLARSFSLLRGYHRVGGVLIGREAREVEKDLDLVDIDFSVDGAENELTIYVTHADGTKTIVGPYDPAIAHLALAYAADGRPTTVTIIPAFPIAEKKILLHPALIDTEVGCHAIQLDQFVNRFGRLDALLRPERIRRKIIIDAYNWTRKVRRLEFMKSAAVRETSKMQKQLKKFAEFARISRVEALAPLRQRSEYFDPDLVEILDACLTESQKSGDAYALCVVQRAERAGRTWQGELTHHWDGKPSLVNVTGVREYAYELDTDMRFTQAPHDIWSGPLRFMVLSGIKMNMVEDWGVEIISESEPWEFEAAQKQLTGTVLNAVSNKPRALQTLRVMQEFTVAQRLFRAAFEGRLGEQFPVERLVEIAKETAVYVEHKGWRTDRWLLGGEISDIEGPKRDAVIQLRESLGVPEEQEATCLGR